MEARKTLKRKHSDRLTDNRREAQHHVKNPYYQKTPNFAALANEFPQLLRNHVQINPVSKKGSIDFSNNDALRGLSKALLVKDFDVNVEIPEDHLCPPLPNRINYLCWISDLLENSSGETSGKTPTILDIGVGPVCIYPILGNKLFNWKFVGSDVDKASVDMCQRNLDANPDLKAHIRAVLVPDSNKLQEIIRKEFVPLLLPEIKRSGGALLKPLSIVIDWQKNRNPNTASNSNTTLAVLRGPVSSALYAMGGHQAQVLLQCEQNINSGASNGDEKNTLVATDEPSGGCLLDVVMCNPPFYDTDEQIQPNERTVCTGSTSEMRTVGGEVAFISAIIYDSLLLKDRVLWYSSMVGKHSSLKPLQRLLAASGVPTAHSFVTTLVQGVTNRWVLAWTFNPAAAQGYKKSLIQAQANVLNANAAAAASSATKDDGIADSGSIHSCSSGGGGGGDRNLFDGVTMVSSLNQEYIDLNSVDNSGTEAALITERDIILFKFAVSIPIIAIGETRLPTDHDILSTNTYRKFFSVTDTAADASGTNTILLDTEPLNDGQDSVSTLTASTRIPTIPLEGFILDALSRLATAIEDSNKALAKDKEAVAYQFRIAAGRLNNHVLGLQYDVVNRDDGVKAYDCLFGLHIIKEVRNNESPAGEWTEEHNTQFVVKVSYVVANVTGACENWSHCVHKFDELFKGNFLRTNRRWRRQIEAVDETVAKK